ncbi:MAG: NDMA-dependent alcohol dehydrogenase [Acidimicrobiales bacterium]|nr:MAG: Zn-dependent alcohol dehydrogenase [Actinomycetota bacterium]MBV6507827.1 NDMA-dependent alcohol dehydrogenase [Acidimicrobiales bacterium]RIK05980.1 MAG: Zn-dependent alcohol dehydrogenase [Acidobacteriota bacterium]
MRAALMRNVGDDKLEVVDDITVADPGPGEVKVKIECTGVCHSDLSGLRGVIPQPPPAVLGHEGAGQVIGVGKGVTSVSEGDKVIVAWSPPCGNCVFCVDHKSPHLCSNIQMIMGATPHFNQGGTPIFGFAGAGTFAECCTLPEQAVIKIDADIPMEVASLIGCAVMTGVGAAINTAQVQPGSNCIVYGCGGVGISVIQGCKVAGAANIVAVDLVESKHDDAKRFGATHACTPDQVDALKGELTDSQGFDYAFEAIGLPTTMRAAFDIARRGGTVTIVGVGRMDQMIEFNAFELFYLEKKFVGSYYGSADVRSDFHRILRLWRSGALDLEGMITKRIKLDDINDAFGAMERGEVIRQVIEM